MKASYRTAIPVRYIPREIGFQEAFNVPMHPRMLFTGISLKGEEISSLLSVFMRRV